MLQPLTRLQDFGGVLDLVWMRGPSLEAVVRQYHIIVGRPVMPPAWALGLHQTCWGYSSVNELQAVLDGYQVANIPLDTAWSDVDHMDSFRDFTLQKERYALHNMQAFLQRLHRQGLRWMPIVDPGIKVDPGFPAYD
jgi:alpha-glucosidase (family GH31 glycosyl hydrolase)